MFELNTHSFVVGGNQYLSKGKLHYFIEQPYMEHIWTLIAYNILSKYISDGNSSIFHEPNTINLNERESNDIKVQCNMFPSIGIEQEIVNATHEFELYRGYDKVEDVMFYTIHLQKEFSKDVRNFILKNLIPEIKTGDKRNTILLAIVTPEMEWHIGLIIVEETLRVYKHATTGLCIQATIFEKREDVLDLLRDF
ncbi:MULTISPECIES: hypothetical protein [Lysinibacillus]|uniref:hypothetical protein n=1 Tax=Lysinibacillus TaxID=400634 RepID=UPI00084A9728|nr:hypothetical protein [Lysinibacillus sphaericus]OEB99790.1 hypothetical protein GY31_22050 [Lysinibacillus sphaericus]